jgi:hypothetical protein
MYEYMATLRFSDNFNRGDNANLDSSLASAWSNNLVPAKLSGNKAMPNTGGNWNLERWYSGSVYNFDSGSVRCSMSAALGEGVLLSARVSSSWTRYYYIQVRNVSGTGEVLHWGAGASTTQYPTGSITGTLLINALRIDVSGTAQKFYSSTDSGDSWTLRASTTDDRAPVGEAGFAFQDVDGGANMSLSWVDNYYAYGLDGPISGSSPKSVVVVSG